MFSISKLARYLVLLIYWFSLPRSFELRHERGAALTQTDHLGISARALVGKPDLNIRVRGKPGCPLWPLNQAESIIEFAPTQVAQLLFTGYPI